MASYGVQLKDKNGNKVYPSPYWPIGSIFLSMNTTNPSTYFGGTWERLTGAYLYAAAGSFSKSTYTGTDTQSTALNVNQIPSHRHEGSTNSDGSHRHNIAYYSAGAGQGSNNDYITNSGVGWSTNYRLNEWITFGDSKSNHSHYFYTNYVGGSQGHSHGVAYLAVVVWQRVA